MIIESNQDNKQITISRIKPEKVPNFFRHGWCPKPIVIDDKPRDAFVNEVRWTGTYIKIDGEFFYTSETEVAGYFNHFDEISRRGETGVRKYKIVSDIRRVSKGKRKRLLRDKFDYAYTHRSNLLSCEQSKELNETRDCTVVALATATGKDYREAHDWMKNNGRPHRRGVHFATVLSKGFAMNFPVKRVNLTQGLPVNSSSVTLNRFVEVYPKGTFIVMVAGHALSVIDGKIYDYTLKPLRRVVSAFEVIK